MYKLKHVYICDHCGNVGMPMVHYYSPDVHYKTMPYGWTKLGKEHLCHSCSIIYKKFKGETRDD